MKLFFTVLFSLFALIIHGQTNALQKTLESFNLKNSNDSDGLIKLGMVQTVRLNSSPNGAGDFREVERRKNLFPKEENITWLEFSVLQSGTMTMRIVPDSASNDYDFILFSGTNTNSLEQIRKGLQKPIRSNCARTQNIENGVTGLSYKNADPNHARQGLGASFSNGLEVKRGEKYILVLNNVTNLGSGATIYFEYWKSKDINGFVTDEDNKPIRTDVIWEDLSSGKILAETTSDSITGKFSFQVPYNTVSKDGFALVAYSDTMVFDEKDFEGSEVSALSGEPLSMVLKELKGGQKMKFNSINFVGDKAEFLATATPSLKRLYRLMKRNKDMTIEIGGHTNGNNERTQKLSEDRAEAVRNYLIERGIVEKRISTIGYGGKFMLHPKDSGEKLASKNRRVEVVVKSY